MAGNDLLERERHAAGNADDSLNPGARHYDEDLINSKKAAPQREFDDDFDGILAANGVDAPDKKVDSHGDTVRRNYNADENINDAKEKEAAGGGSMYNNGTSGGGGGVGGGFAGKLQGFGGKKLGPTGGIIGLLLFAFIGVGGGTVSLAGSLLINVKEIFHNDRADASRANKQYSRAFYANKFNSKNNACGSQIKIKCKMGTVSKSEVKKFQKEGFKIKGAEIDKDGKDTGKRIEDDKTVKPDYDESTDTDANRHDPDARVSIEEVEFPDGTKTKNGKEFYTHADKNPDALRVAERGFNSRSSFYLNKFFSKTIMDGKFKFSKAKKSFPDGEGQDGKEKQDKAFNDQTDGLSDEDKNGEKLKSKVTEAEGKADEHAKAKDGRGSGKGNAFLTTAQILCQSYKLARGSVAAVKLYQIAQLAKFGLMFLQSADEIKDGKGDGPKTTYLSNNLTYYENNEKMKEDNEELKVQKGDPNPRYNLSATDSQGYRIAAHGDVSKLTSFAQAYILGGNGVIRTVDNYTKKVEGLAEKIPVIDGTGRDKIRNLCRKANSDAASIIGACAGLLPVIAAIGTGAAPGPGTAVASAVGGGVCACVVAGNINIPLTDVDLAEINPGCKALEESIKFAKDKFLQLLKEKVFREYIEKALKAVSVGSDTKGVDAGNAIAAGVGLMLSTTASGYGTKPARSKNKNKEITDYISYTQPLENTYIALDKDDARENPLDASNKYSLVGSLVRSFNLADNNPQSLYGNLLTTIQLFPSAIETSVTGQPVSALYNQPSTAANGESGRYDCDDDDLKDIGAAGDKFCSIVGVTSVDEMKKASEQATVVGNQNINDLIDYMSMKGKYANGLNRSPEKGNGYTDNTGGQCTKTDGSDDERVEGHCKGSTQPAIDENGKPNTDSSYDKYLKYCSDKREQPWGSQSEPYEQGTEMDQAWYSGKKCTEDSKMMKSFRAWTNYCLQSGTRDNASNCYTDDATEDEEEKSSSECAGGGQKAIYTCALKYDDYRYKWGGGHGGNGQEWIKKFNSGGVPKWEAIFDCSGLVRMAYIEAMGKEAPANTAPDGFASDTAHWTKISLEEAEQGDIVTSSGHVAIVQSNDKSGRKFKIFHASTEGEPKESNILHGEQSYGGTIAAYRAK